MPIYLKTLDLNFPFLGVVEDSSFTDQPEGTTPFAQNVRGYDVVSAQDVGCRRPPLMGIAGSFTNSTQSIDAISSGFISGLTDTVTFLRGGSVYGGSAGNYSTFVGLSAPGTNPSYTPGTTIGLAFAYGAFWISQSSLALRKADFGGGGVSIPAATAGAIPTGATILALYRGRLFHAGFSADPFNYIASRAGDVLDYNYSASDQAGAFSGNNTPQAGLIGDRITALIPFSDVTMVMGMANSLAVMQGDPKAGGYISFLSREVGIVSNTSWARSPDGRLFFMGADGLYVLNSPESAPKNISRGRLDRTLGRLDYSKTTILMGWDPIEQGIKIFLVRTDTGATTGVFWDSRKDAFWPDTFSSTHFPTCLSYVRGSGGAGAALIIGYSKGAILQTSRDYTVHTTEIDITATVKFDSITPFGPNVSSKITTMRHLWGNDSTSFFHADWAVYSGDDPVSVWNATQSSMSGNQTHGGYQGLIRTRARGSTHQLQISNTSGTYHWTIENVTLTVSPSGRVRT